MMHGGTKLIIIVFVFLLIFSLILFVVLAGSNPLSHKQLKKNNNKSTDASSNKPITTSISNLFDTDTNVDTDVDTNLSASGTVNAGGLFGGGCLGSECKVITSKGLIKLKDVNPGDKLLSCNHDYTDISLETVWCIRTHGPVLIKHYNITFDSGDNLILTPEHLLITEDKKYVKAEDIRVNQRMLNLDKSYSSVLTIEEILDVPLTPILLTGNVVLPNRTVVSCWSHDEENVKYITKLIEMIKPYTLKYTPEEMNVIMSNGYDSLDRQGKNTDDFNKVLTSLNVELIEVN